MNILITGTTSGIGKYLAEKLCKNYLVCNDLDLQDILTTTFNNTFNNNILVQDKIYFRKEIVPLICEKLN